MAAMAQSDRADTDRAAERARNADLVAATLAGDRQAFGTLVAAYQRRVFALAYRYCRHEGDAADLTQRAFLKAFESLGGLKDASSFAPWLFRIAANLAKNRIRFSAGKRFEDVDNVPLHTEPRLDDALDYRTRRQRMRNALDDLPDKQRRCILLRIDAELSFRDIGEAVGCSEGSARVNFHHGMKALRRRLVGADPTAAPATESRSTRRRKKRGRSS
jgi:RNA polymerase sigma-70 factor (ECF subfamily)